MSDHLDLGAVDGISLSLSLSLSLPYSSSFPRSHLFLVFFSSARYVLSSFRRVVSILSLSPFPSSVSLSPISLLTPRVVASPSFVRLHNRYKIIVSLLQTSLEPRRSRRSVPGDGIPLGFALPLLITLSFFFSFSFTSTSLYLLLGELKKKKKRERNSIDRSTDAFFRVIGPLVIIVTLFARPFSRTSLQSTIDIPFRQWIYEKKKKKEKNVPRSICEIFLSESRSFHANLQRRFTVRAESLFRKPRRLSTKRRASLGKSIAFAMTSR